MIKINQSKSQNKCKKLGWAPFRWNSRLRRWDIIRRIFQKIIINELSEAGLFTLKNPADTNKGLAPTVDPDDTTEKSPQFLSKYKKVSESDIEEARKAGGYKIGDAGKFAEAKELYSKGLYADVLNAIESAGEDGISQKDLGVKLGKADSTSLNPILVKFKEIGVFSGGKLAKAEKPEAGDEVDDSAPEEFDAFYATDIEDEMPEEEPKVASDKEIAKLAGDIGDTGKSAEINNAINIVKNLSTKIQGMKKGIDRDKKMAALKQYISKNKTLLKGRDISVLTNNIIGNKEI